MSYINYIFKGFGHSHAKYKISNDDIYDAVKKSFLSGFKENRISNSEKYKKYKEKNPQSNPFQYFVNEIMGFNERYHVTPFPPTLKKLFYAESSLDLCVKAVEKCLLDANLKPENIDAWFVSTVSPHRKAPGIASFVKSYFVNSENNTPAFTLLSGCSGFSLNLERAIEWMTNNPNAKNVVIAHTETMSAFLTQRIKFIPFVTFGDAAAAVVLSKIKDSDKYGIIYINNSQDQNMLDYVGVDSKKNLYMNDVLIKDRAIVNMTKSINDCIENTNININDIDYFVPHQTGNAIIFPVAENFKIPKEKIILYGQYNYGNVSSATIPITLSLLNEKNKLTEKSKVLCSTAGVGGNFSSFMYIHKTLDKKQNFYLYSNDLKNKNCLILGASGFIGKNIANEINKRGGNLILHYNSNSAAIESFDKAVKLKCDFSNKQELNNFIYQLEKLNIKFDYVFNCVDNIDAQLCMKVNYYAPIQIIKKLMPKINSAIVSIGSSCEDFSGFENYADWISSKRAFHGFLASASGEFYKYGIKINYIQIGFTENGISSKLSEKYIFKTMLLSGQDEYIKTDILVNKIVNSAYVHKVLGFKYSYENAMVLARFGYFLEVDV